eukprot:gnl/TRDRNA2_/TRDRNA2_163223_c0_seq2.p1 gnl/TRDRNA2_/TRDRNA2_163223_c0~~gnl/TRDRNA2_/TRDRNA2_163223_c0_seq2.p1  ORF type:complete len:362 (+),score=33.51 gnl/TRDRNA2_/TRDRNA2_163223_c0_seq2:97-1182(+)
MWFHWLTLWITPSLGQVSTGFIESNDLPAGQMLVTELLKEMGDAQPSAMDGATCAHFDRGQEALSLLQAKTSIRRGEHGPPKPDVTIEQSLQLERVAPVVESLARIDTDHDSQSVQNVSAVQAWWDDWWSHEHRLNDSLLAEPRGQPAKMAAKTAVAVQDWWNKNAAKDFQHLDRTYVQQTEAAWNAFLPHFQWQSKRVLDYGIGGGYLGEVLLNKYGISSYIGIDISEKALQATRKTLANWTDKVELHLTPVHFSEVAPDILVSQQVIQHFPSVDYFESFLENVDNSRARQLMLHFRKSADERTYATDAYSKGRQQDVTFALLTDSKFIQNRLKNYRLVLNESRPMCCHTTGVYTRWDAI